MKAAAPSTIAKRVFSRLRGNLRRLVPPRQRPTQSTSPSSNLNYLAGQTIPNMMLVPLGPRNTVTFHNSAGTVNVIADLLGYYS